jgi:DNA-binding transcriptional regulator YiaG
LKRPLTAFKNSKYTSWNIKNKGKKIRQCRADRLAHASRFRAMLADLRLTHPEAAQLLHVSLRTLQNWLSARHEVPYAAYKLLRLMRYMELPGDAWRGWHFSAGQLITPEGRSISASEGAWWSLLVRQARGFAELRKDLQKTCQRCEDRLGGSAAGLPGFAPDPVEVAVTPHFSPENRTVQPPACDFTPSQVSYRLPVFSPKKPHQEPRS